MLDLHIIHNIGIYLIEIIFDLIHDCFGETHRVVVLSSIQKETINFRSYHISLDNNISI